MLAGLQRKKSWSHAKFVGGGGGGLEDPNAIMVSIQSAAEREFITFLILQYYY